LEQELGIKIPVLDLSYVDQYAQVFVYGRWLAVQWERSYLD